MPTSNCTVTAIIPAYNEAPRISATVTRCLPFVDEIIVIDDASQDDAARLARQAGAMVLRHDKQRGYIDAIKTGFRAASGDILVTLDADGEFDVADIPALVSPIADDRADVVQGHRDLIPRPSERLLTWLAQRKAPVGDSGTGLRALRSSLARQLEIKGACICGVLALEVIARGGRLLEVPITLRAVDKPRRIAWFHVRQLFYVLPWLVRRSG